MKEVNNIIANKFGVIVYDTPIIPSRNKYSLRWKLREITRKYIPIRIKGMAGTIPWAWAPAKTGNVIRRTLKDEKHWI